MANTKRKKRKKKNSKKFKISPIISVILLLAILAFGYVYNEYFKDNEKKTIPIPEGSVSVHFIDVGQGDSQLIISSGGETLLIDAGTSQGGKDVIEYLDKYDIDTLDYVIFTHFDSDHIGGGSKVLESVSKVGKVFAPAYTPKESEKTAYSLVETINKVSDEYVNPKQGDSFELSGGVLVKVLSSEKIDDKGKNGDSIVTMIGFGESDFLLTGDATKENESEILSKYSSYLDCEVMTACHHGSRESNTDAFLSAASPDYVVISCGEGNSYLHPHKEALDRFAKVTDNIFRTDISGDIVFVSNGSEISYTLEKEPEASAFSYTSPVYYISDYERKNFFFA